ncbi:hypothetical protein LTR86_011246 [Recurvomyces mirabilis]|nr:hypothetical protein LTR86_011246 [Recurvomyces mirabilis]
MAMVQSVLHTIIMFHDIDVPTSAGRYSITVCATLSTSHDYPALTVQQAIASIVALNTLPWGRQYVYEAFLNSHLILAVTLAITLWIHLRTQDSYSRLLLEISVVIFASSCAYQVVRRLYRNVRLSVWKEEKWSPRLQVARVSMVEDHESSLILELTLARPWKIRPGQFIYLTVSTLRWASFMQRHPLTIVWWDTLDEAAAEPYAVKIYLMVEPRLGWSRRIMSDPGRLNKQVVWLDGPFGRAHDLHEYSTVLFFVSDVGMFAVLPLLKDLTYRTKVARAKTRRIRIVWQTSWYHPALKVWMHCILDDKDLDRSLLRATIHGPAIEQPTTLYSGSNGSSGWSGSRDEGKSGRRVKVKPGVPEAHVYMTKKKNKDIGRPIAVVVSAYDSLREDIRHEALLGYRDNMRLIELEYQPTNGMRCLVESAA